MFLKKYLIVKICTNSHIKYKLYLYIFLRKKLFLNLKIIGQIVRLIKDSVH